MPVSAESADVSRPRGGRAKWLLWMIPVVAAVAIYWPSLSGGLVWDDSIVQKNQMVAFHSVRDAFVFDAKNIYQWSTIYYRPIVTLSYMLDEAVSDFLRTGKYISAEPLPAGVRTDPRVSHAACVLYHAIATFFVWMFCRQVLLGRPWKELGAVIAALVFALHPIHTETVCMINGRSDSLAAMFVMPAIVAAMRFFSRPSVWAMLLSVVLFFGGLMCKEVALAGALLLPFLWLASIARPRDALVAIPDAPDDRATPAARRDGPTLPRQRSRFVVFVSLAVAIVLYGAAVGAYFYIRARMKISAGYALRVTLREWIDRFAAALGYYMTKAFWPWPQFHYPEDLPPVAQGWIVVAVVAGVGVASIVLAVRRKPLLITSLGWILCTLAPSMGIALRGGSKTPVAERYLYLPVVGVGLLLAGLISVRWRSRALRGVALLLAIVALGGYGYGTWRRGFIWLDNVALWKDATEKVPQAGMPWFTLGMAYMDDSQFDDAERCFKKSIESKYNNDGYSLAWNSLGVVYLKRGDDRAALEAFGKSIKIKPTYQTPYFNIGNIMMKTAERKFAAENKWDVDVLNKAHFAYSKAIECYRMYTWAYLERGKCSTKLATDRMLARDAPGTVKFLQNALQDLNMVIKLEPNSPFASDAQKLVAGIQQQLAKFPASQASAGSGKSP